MKRNLKMYFNTLIHPIAGFEDICEEKCFSFKSSLCLFFILFFSMIIDRQFVGFAFSTTNTKVFNILLLLAGVVITLALWTVTNWMVTTLFEGKGRAKEIWVVTLTAALPYSFSLLAHAIISNVLVLDESVFLRYIMIIGILWTGMLLFCGLIVLHDFTFMRVVWTTLLTIGFMAVIVFLTVILYSLFQQIYSFFVDIIDEMAYRL